MQILFRELQSHRGLFIFEFENCFKCSKPVLYFTEIAICIKSWVHWRASWQNIFFYLFIDKCVLCHITRGGFGTINKIFTSFYSGENGLWRSPQPQPLVSQWECWTWGQCDIKMVDIKFQGKGIHRWEYSLRVVKSNVFFMQKLSIELYIHCSSCCV